MPIRSRTRVLVVDDFERFRRFISLTLQKKPELEVVGEACDGLEAVEKAQELQPDLILLDLGLPKLNGIEAARRIRQLSPASQILFVSQESSAAVAQEALRTGGRGYVVKANAGQELMPALEAVLMGGRFISSHLAVPSGVSAVTDQPVDHLPLQDVVAPPLQDLNHRHEVAFYGDDGSLVRGFSHFIEDALRDGNAVIVLARESHREPLLQTLRENGLDMSAAIEDRRYIPFDVVEVLGTLFVGNTPDPERFRKVAGDIIAAAKAGRGLSRVALCGECAPTLLSQGKAEAAIQLENLWDDTIKRYDTDTLCGYLSNDFRGAENSRVFDRICAEHTAVVQTDD